jgi:hypothetical protein
MKRRARSLMIGVGALLLWALSPTLALADLLGAWVSIDDRTDIQMASLNDSGFIPATNPTSYGGLFNSTGSGITTTPAPGVTTTITNEDVGVLGAVDMTFHYTDSNPLPIFTSQRVNFHFYEPISTLLSDTLSITFTGFGGLDMLVQLHWRSATADPFPFPPPELPGAHDLYEGTFASGKHSRRGFPCLDRWSRIDIGP